jgi:hypothetical protein
MNPINQQENSIKEFQFDMNNEALKFLASGALFGAGITGLPHGLSQAPTSMNNSTFGTIPTQAYPMFQFQQVRALEALDLSLSLLRSREVSTMYYNENMHIFIQSESNKWNFCNFYMSWYQNFFSKK